MKCRALTLTQSDKARLALGLSATIGCPVPTHRSHVPRATLAKPTANGTSCVAKGHQL